MAKVIDYTVQADVTDIMSRMIKSFPKIFNGFDVNLIGCVHTKNKAKSKKPLAIKSVRYPYDVWVEKTYIIEVADETWKEMDEKRKNIAVFRTMCAIPEGGFDAESKNYGRIKKPDYEMYAEEFAVVGGIPDWMDNDAAIDPMSVSKEKIAKKRTPVTAEAVESVGE